jgi:hypothetical protein
MCYHVKRISISRSELVAIPVTAVSGEIIGYIATDAWFYAENAQTDVAMKFQSS